MFFTWLRLKRWFRNFVLALSTHTPISWRSEVEELTDIANEALDKKGYPRKK